MKGMQKISRGRGFGGALKYVFGDPNAKFLAASALMTGSNVTALTSEFRLARTLRPDIKKPVWHQSLRLPRGESLSDGKLLAIAHDYMAKMGFDPAQHQYVVVMHDDPEGQHIHIVASRVGLDGKVWLGQNENLNSTRVIQGLERAHGLALTQGPQYETYMDANGRERARIKMPEVRKPKKGETERHQRIQATCNTNEPSPRAELLAILLRAKALGNLAAFVDHAERAGVQIHAKFGMNGKMFGLAFSFKDQKFKGSGLGRAFGWGYLGDELNYDAERDAEFLRERLIPFGEMSIVGDVAVTSLGRDIGVFPYFEAKAGRGHTILYIRRPADVLAFVDHGQKITFKEQEVESLHAGLRLAHTKWPQGFELTGPASFKQAMVREAVKLGLEGSITNPELRDYIEEQVQKRQSHVRPQPPAVVPQRAIRTGTRNGPIVAEEVPNVPAATPTIDRETAYQAELAHLEAFAEKHGHGEVYENLKAEIEDRYFPGRRRARDAHEAAYRARLVQIEAAGAKVPTRGPSGASSYLSAACAFLASERRSGREPDQVAWRGFDRNFLGQVVGAEFRDAEWSAMLTRLSPAAVRSAAAIERQGGLVDVIVKNYGIDVAAKARSDIRKSEALADVPGKSGGGVPAAPKAI